MADASYVRSSFLGGEWSLLAQGRLDRPDYVTALNVCRNGLPNETGSWVRRPGFALAAQTRNGAAGHIHAFDFRQSSPYNIEMTAGYLRFFTGTTLVTTNDLQAITAISAANPAEVTTGTHGWATGNQVYFSGLAANNPLLQNRAFLITVTGATKFTLADAMTGTTIDGATLGTFVSGNVGRVLEIVSPYIGNTWQSVRVILADVPAANSTTPGAVFLQHDTPPYVLSLTLAPTATTFAEFSLAAAVFKDGPYFDPVPGGTLATPSGLTGNINLTLSFAAYDATRSYAIGDYVSSGGVNYKSIADANLNHAPPNATYWTTVSSTDAIGPDGFQGTDIGRHVRLFSEPPLWVVGGTYTAGTSVVAYAGVYWKALANNTGATTNTPNTSPTIWALFPTGAIWSWGKITALLNEIDRALAGSVNIGNMTQGGGLAAAFDGITDQAEAACAIRSAGLGATSISGYVGKNYSGAAAQTIASATIFPSNNFGFLDGSAGTGSITIRFTLNLRAKATAPASASDGTLLGTTGSIPNQFTPISIISNDSTTTWNYVWVETIVVASLNSGATINNLTAIVAELKLFNAPGTGTTNGVTVQLLGDNLLYTSAVRIWRLGLFSSTTGFPTCGTYHEGRLWLSGILGNRIDASKSNDIFNFAPTNPDGSVSDNNAIAYTFNAKNVNTIFWIEPDQLGLVAGTAAGEWLVQASALNLQLTPTNIQAHLSMKHKCANIEPRRTGLTLTVVQAFKRSLLEFFHDTYSGKFSAHNLAEMAKHITKTGIEQIGFQQETAPIIWASRADGTLIGCTYKRESLVSSQPPNFAGWHRHTLGSGRTVESLTVGASADGTLDALAVIANDASNMRVVNVMTPILEEGAALTDAAYLDDAITPTSTSSDNATPSPYGGLTLNGLWPLNGKTATAWLGGLDCGDYLVTNGSITVPYGDGVSGGTARGLFTAAFVDSFNGAMPMVVGFTYNSDGQIVRPNAPVEVGSRTGPGFGKLRRSHQVAVQLEGTQGISFGTSFSKLDPAIFKHDNDVRYVITEQFSGILSNVPLTDTYSIDSMLCWRISRPYIGNVAAIGGFIESTDKQ